MIRKKWNDHWQVSKPVDSPMMASVSGKRGGAQAVTLPHDAMIYESKCQETGNMHQTGFYPGDIYFYEKKIHVPSEWNGKSFTIEFEGVYRHAQVYINGDYAGGHPRGYTNFYISAEEFLKYGEENSIRVIANNSMEQNSRWYSGSGIYRNVNILIGESVHIEPDGLRITTPEVNEGAAIIETGIDISSRDNRTKNLRVITEIFDEEGNVVAANNTPVTVFGLSQVKCRQRIFLSDPKLWDCENPYLYSCRCSLTAGEKEIDRAESTFGIRTLSMNPGQGLMINGKEIKLRGACIHHDNGIIGACTLERAEERRCQQLKEAGFNCIRSAHNPISKAMLDACDREGMLVLDELSDMWTRSKNHNDDAMFFTEHWEFDVVQMVAKDYNHPSVIMYFTGNEIQEAGTSKGAELNRKIANRFKELDPYRYTTSSVNGLLPIMDRIGEVYESVTGKSQEVLMRELEAHGSSNAGSDAVNSMMSTLNGELADQLACSQILTDILEEFTDATDLAGYNYLTARHAIEPEINPNRVVLGAETLPADIARLWKIVEENKHVIGDMTWTGYDYLGEAGIGIFYYDGRMGFMPNWPDSVAYVGDIDLIGRRRTISYYREIVYGIRKEPYIAVERLNRYGQTPNKTGWMWNDSIASWTWHGYEDKPAVVEVYSNSDEVELILNDRSLGRKKVGSEKPFIAGYEFNYMPGKLEVVSYQNGVETGRHVLESADNDVSFDISCDRMKLKADGADLAYIMVGFKDSRGIHNTQIRKSVTVSVEGVGSLQGFGSADPESAGQYQDSSWDTYDGNVLAVVRAGYEAGEIYVTFETDGCEGETIVIAVDK